MKNKTYIIIAIASVSVALGFFFAVGVRLHRFHKNEKQIYQYQKPAPHKPPCINAETASKADLIKEIEKLKDTIIKKTYASDSQKKNAVQKIEYMCQCISEALEKLNEMANSADEYWLMYSAAGACDAGTNGEYPYNWPVFNVKARCYALKESVEKSKPLDWNHLSWEGVAELSNAVLHWYESAAYDCSGIVSAKNREEYKKIEINFRKALSTLKARKETKKSLYYLCYRFDFSGYFREIVPDNERRIACEKFHKMERASAK